MRSALAIALTLLFCGPFHGACASATDEIAVGGELRDATLAGLNGAARHLADFRGKPLIINVWASWCGPCREEMASLERLAWLDARGQFNVIGISTDDDAAQAAAWLRASNATINQFIDRERQMESMLGASRLPLTVLVDARGRVLAKVYGAQAWDDASALRRIETAFGIHIAPPGR